MSAHRNRPLPYHAEGRKQCIARIRADLAKLCIIVHEEVHEEYMDSATDPRLWFRSLKQVEKGD